MKLIKGVDYYINEQGYWVFTAKYLLERGYCCQNGCKHCPYSSTNKDTSCPTQKNDTSLADSSS